MTTKKVVLALCLVAVAFIAGYRTNGYSTVNANAPGVKPVSYTCPMHPDYRADRLGDCPICGMRLKLASKGSASDAGTEGDGGPGAVNINAAQQQLIGVRTEIAGESSNSSALRLPGRIAPDDSRVYRLIAATDGWVRELGRNPAGSLVKPNEMLASYFVRDLVSAQQNYLYAYQTAAQSNQPNVVPQRNSAALNLRLALDALRSLGMTDAEVEELQRKGQPSTDMHLSSPSAGLVLARSITPGQRFDKGSELYKIADISRVWVLADVFERDRDAVRPGIDAIVRYRGQEFRARATELLPQFDPQSRVLKTRFELDNPGLTLRPDMFVEVEIQVKAARAITVPVDAVVDLGLHKTVYVQRGIGLFEPRTVQTGARIGDRVEVTAGLSPGESVVVAGNFMIDSESRMRAPLIMATATAPPAAAKRRAMKDAVCGMDVASDSPGALKAEYRGTAYFFCSERCRKDFESNPGRYAPRRAS